MGVGFVAFKSDAIAISPLRLVFIVFLLLINSGQDVPSFTAYFFVFHAMSRPSAWVTVPVPAFLAARARACCAVAALLLRSLARALFSITRFRRPQAVTGVISLRASALVILRPLKSERSCCMKHTLHCALAMGFPLQKRLTCFFLPHLVHV